MKYFILAISLTSCVTTHYGQIATSEKNLLNVSCGRSQDLSSEFYDMYTCSIENTSNQWVKVKVTNISLDPSDNIFVSTPLQLKNYINAFRFEKEKRDYNTDVFLASLVISASAVSQSSQHTNIGNYATGGALIAAGSNELSEVYTKNQYHYGSDHLLSDTTEIPAQLFVRKNILLEKRNKELVVKNFTICLEQPNKECISVPVR